MLVSRSFPWSLPESEVTPEAAWLSRRELMKLGAAALIGSIAGPALADDSKGSKLYPATPNKAYRVLDPKSGKPVPLTAEQAATTFNNFYEFTTTKTMVHRLVDKFVIDPWSVKIHGHVKKPQTLSLQQILKACPLEERIYRFRCVEAWSMVVPWTGFPLSKLLALVEPTSKAKYVRLLTFNRPKQAPGIRLQPHYKWPYYEGLRLDEAMHPLTMLATGIYGKPLPKQSGAPIRLVVPWKYGYKSIKSIVEIELTDKQPRTFWNDLAPGEYDFLANVNPKVPHPRWSQATERMIPGGRRRKTELYNGYAAQVAKLYR